MIDNLASYFLPEQEFYLDKISYNRIEKKNDAGEYSLNCLDNIEVEVGEDAVRVTVRRSLKFEPEAVFELSVSFGAILQFMQDKKGEYDWSKIDLAEEFRENGQFVLGNLLNRISLLIAEITASFGQMPFVLAPMIAKKET